MWSALLEVMYSRCLDPQVTDFNSLFFRIMSLSECAFKEKKNKVYLLEGGDSNNFWSFFKKSLQLFKKYLGDIH